MRAPRSPALPRAPAAFRAVPVSCAAASLRSRLPRLSRAPVVFQGEIAASCGQHRRFRARPGLRPRARGRKGWRGAGGGSGRGISPLRGFRPEISCLRRGYLRTSDLRRRAAGAWSGARAVGADFGKRRPGMARPEIGAMRNGRWAGRLFRTGRAGGARVISGFFRMPGAGVLRPGGSGAPVPPDRRVARRLCRKPGRAILQVLRAHMRHCGALFHGAPRWRSRAQAMQVGMVGSRSSRAGAISSPHSVHQPYSPSSMRASAARMR